MKAATGESCRAAVELVFNMRMEEPLKNQKGFALGSANILEHVVMTNNNECELPCNFRI